MRAHQRPAMKKARLCSAGFLICGERGIRTPGTLRYSGFQDRRNRPLCHLSDGGTKITTTTTHPPIQCAHLVAIFKRREFDCPFHPHLLRSHRVGGRLGPTQRPWTLPLGGQLGQHWLRDHGPIDRIVFQSIGGRSLYRRISPDQRLEALGDECLSWRVGGGFCAVGRGVLLGPPPQPWRQHPMDRPRRTPPKRRLQPRGSTAAKRPAKSTVDVGVLAPGCGRAKGSRRHCLWPMSTPT